MPDLIRLDSTQSGTARQFFHRLTCWKCKQQVRLGLGESCPACGAAIDGRVAAPVPEAKLVMDWRAWMEAAEHE